MTGATLDITTAHADVPARRASDVSPADKRSECYGLLRGLIMNGELLPNEHHMEAAIAERLGVDPADVHYAACELHRDGLLTTEPRGGFWISPLRPSAVVATFRQASMLEARAAFVAALHSPTSIGMAALDDAVLNMENSLFQEDSTRWARASHHFHRSLIQCAGHSGIAAAALPLTDLTHRARMLSLRFGPRPVEATQSHSHVVEAIRAGLAAEARDLHLGYWRSAAVEIVGILEQHNMDSVLA